MVPAVVTLEEVAGKGGLERHQGENRWDPHSPSPAQARLSPNTLPGKFVLVKKRGRSPRLIMDFFVLLPGS